MYFSALFTLLSLQLSDKINHDSVDLIKNDTLKSVLDSGNSNYGNLVGILILIILVIIFVIVLSKIGQLKISILEKRKEKLEKIIYERTEDLIREKEKVEKLLEETEYSKNKLQEANELKSKLMHIAAHDLKNPLQAILGFEYIIKEDFNNIDPGLEEIHEAIFNSSKKMLSIVSEILENKDAFISNIYLTKKIENLSQMIIEVCENNRVRANQKKQTIYLDLDDSIYIDVDKIWFIKALDNLISNAIKYSDFNKAIKITISKDQKFVYIKVRDQGKGFSETEKEKLFKKYQKLDNKPTDGESSTGLGLYIAKDIINNHGGDIFVESKIGEGSEFTIKLLI